MTQIYWYIVIACLVLGIILPQHGYYRKYYIYIMAIVHAFIGGWRYKFLTGDLLKYNTEFQDVHFFGYLSKRVVHDWKNTGFYWLMKFLCDTFDGDFQILLIVTSVFIEIAVAIIIYKYSTRPWLSYLVWNCFAFYIFGFSAVKQAFAMAIVMFAFIFIMEDKPKGFYVLTLLAAFTHLPAIAFLPAYWIAKRKINLGSILIYISAIIFIFVFQNPLVKFMTDLYYEESEFEIGDNVALGGRFFMMIFILVIGYLIKGYNDVKFKKVYNLIAVAALFQMFSGYDNVFTRFADYYFQFTIILMPLMFSNEYSDPVIISTNKGATAEFNNRSLKLFTVLLSVILIWFYQTTTMGRTERFEHDYLDYHFTWDKSADAWRQ